MRRGGPEGRGFTISCGQLLKNGLSVCEMLMDVHDSCKCLQFF